MDMMKIRELISGDVVINDEQLDIESLKIPQLYGKYLNIYQDEKALYHSHNFQHKKLKRLKWEYYTGKLSEDQLKELGWEQFDLKILRQDIDLYLESDSELVALEMKLTVQKEKTDYLQSFLKELANRQYHIRDAILWRKFISGVN